MNFLTLRMIVKKCRYIILFSLAFGNQTLRAESSYNWGIGVRAGGVMGDIAGGGIDFFKQYDQNNQLGIMLLGGTSSEKDSFGTNTAFVSNRTDYTGTLALIQLRHFFSHVFYGTVGFGNRTIQGNYQASSKISLDKLTQEFESSSYVVSGSIGHQWKFENSFFVGADWIGVTVPLSSSYGAKTQTIGATDSEIKDLQDKAMDLAKKQGQETTEFYLLLSIGGLW